MMTRDHHLLLQKASCRTSLKKFISSRQRNTLMQLGKSENCFTMFHSWVAFDHTIYKRVFTLGLLQLTKFKSHTPSFSWLVERAKGHLIILLTFLSFGMYVKWALINFLFDLAAAVDNCATLVNISRFDMNTSQLFCTSLDFTDEESTVLVETVSQNFKL